MSPQDQPTPRADAAEKEFFTKWAVKGACSSTTARELERELAAANARIDQIQGAWRDVWLERKQISIGGATYIRRSKTSGRVPN